MLIKLSSHVRFFDSGLIDVLAFCMARLSLSCPVAWVEVGVLGTDAEAGGKDC